MRLMLKRLIYKMTVSQQIVERYNENQTIKKWKVPSKSEKRKYHLVRQLKDGSFRCNCIAGQMKRECSHQKIVKSIL